MNILPPRRWPPSPGRRRRFAFGRRGVTLLELVAVVTLMGIFASIAASRSDGFFQDVTIRTEAETVAGLLHAAKRRAILTGTDSGLRFESGGGFVTAYVPVERTGGALVDIGDPIPASEGIEVSSGQAEILFDFEGAASTSGASVDFVGKERRLRISLAPVTSSIRVSPVP